MVQTQASEFKKKFKITAFQALDEWLTKWKEM